MKKSQKMERKMARVNNNFMESKISKYDKIIRNKNKIGCERLYRDKRI